MKLRVFAVIGVSAIVSGACSSDDSGASTTTVPVVATTTTAAPATTSTTSAATTTTTPATTTTTEAVAYGVDQTPIVAELQPYSAGGADLVNGGTVQAHWYQWNGLYVVLYRGFDASDGSPICAGNSVQEGAEFSFVSDSPHNGAAEEICDGAPRIAEPPSGVGSCEVLLYMVTEIPVETVGTLYGTLEIVKGGVGDGQTSSIAAKLAATPSSSQDSPRMSSHQRSSTLGARSSVASQIRGVTRLIDHAKAHLDLR